MKRTKIVLAILCFMVGKFQYCQSQNIGIGVVNPIEKLEVDGGFRCDSMMITENMSNILGSVIARLDTNNNKILLANDNISLTSTGKLGIGTENPNFQVHVAGEFNTNAIYAQESMKGPTLNGERSIFAELDHETDTVSILNGSFKYLDSKFLTVTSDLTVKDPIHINGALKVGQNGSDITTMRVISIQRTFGSISGQAEITYSLNLNDVPSDAAVGLTIANGELPGALAIGQVYVEEVDKIRFCIFNMGSNSQTLGPTTLVFTIID